MIHFLMSHEMLGRGILKMLKHFDDREMSITSLRVVVATSVMGGIGKSDSVTPPEIAKAAGLTVAEVVQEIPDLLESRHLHEVVPTFGKVSYRLGSVGGTFRKCIRAIFGEQ